MRNIENIGVPYRESSEYVHTLVSRATEQAISQRSCAKRLPLRRMVAAAAVAVLLLAGIGVTAYHHVTTSGTAVAESRSPVDDFLGSLTDEEVMVLAYYELEEIEY